MGKVIGIDLGTTNSCVAVLENDQPVVITNSEGQRTTPSVVAFTKNGERLVGEPAKRQAAVNVERTFFSVKRQMGSGYRAKVDGKMYSAPEISSMILRKLKKNAEEYLGEAVTDAVITVPAYFSDAQRQATKDAGISAEDLGMVLLVGGSTRVPAVVDEVRVLTGKEPSHNLNPDECVALGAAIQGGKIGGELVAGSSAAEIILMDVTPLSLGIETLGGVFTKIIDRNTTIPARYSQIFTTAGSFQTSVDIKVLQGERQFSKDNKLIGNFRLRGIKPAPAGVPQIEVAFDIDANGIVQVSAKDLGTGKHQEITITASSNLSDAEIERAIREAAEYEATDGERKAYIDARGEADTLIRQVENALSDKQKKKSLEGHQKKQIKSALSYTKKLVARTKPGNVSKDQALEIQRAASDLRNAASVIL